MMLDVFIVSLLLGLIRRGSFSGFARVQLNGWGWIAGGFILQFGALALSLRGVDFFSQWGPWIYPASMLMIAVGAWRNRAQPGFLLMCAGVLLNFVAIAANGGTMPVSVEALSTAGILEEVGGAMTNPGAFSHTVFDEPARLHWLTDVIPVPPPYPIPRTISIGDVVLSLGLFFFVQRTMVTRRRYISGIQLG